ncbi:Fibroblast growth factor receptor, partial [Nesidiocoris tenuis]
MKNRLLGLLLLSLTTGAVSGETLKFEVTEKRREVVATVGQNVNLTCSLEKESPSKVSWQKDGSKINTQNVPRVKLHKEVLTIRNVKVKDGGEYSCFPEEHGSSHKTSEQKGPRQIILRVDKGKLAIDNFKDLEDGAHEDDEHDTPVSDEEYGVPSFTNYTSMHDLIAKIVGDNCTLSCLSYGVPTPVIKWYRDDTEIAAAHNSELHIFTIKKEDSGNYSCEVSNMNGTIRHTTQLLVFDSDDELPIITETPTNMSVSIGQSAIFNCKVASKFHSLIQWVQHNSPIIFNAGTPLEHIIQSDQRRRVVSEGMLIINSTQLEDTGWYTCLVNSPKGFAYSSASLHVRAVPPVFTKPEKMHIISIKPAGSTLRLTCHAKGVPTPTIKWLKNGQPPKRSLGSVKYGRWSLSLEDLVTSDTGNYSCEVCNHECIYFTHKVMVQERMRHRPILTLAPINKTQVVGSTAMFKCQFLSDLHPHLGWYEGKVSVPNTTESDFLETLVKTGDDNNTDPEVLVLNNITHEDEGWYTCIAGNTLGFSHSSAYLTVVDELEQDQDKDALPFNVIFAISVAVVCLFLILLVLNSLRTLKREKIKKLHALEAERAAAITQWIKKVIVEKQCHEQDTLLPIVKIEKQKSRVANPDSLVSEYELPLDGDWEFPRSSLELSEVLGEGAFGKVVKAEARGIAQPDFSSIVAVKMLKEGHTDAELMVLVSEMEMMKMIGRHTNIINLLGCCTQGGPLYVIVEFAPYGNLRDFLRQHRPPSGYEPAIGEHLIDRNTLTQKDLVSFAYQ